MAMRMNLRGTRKPGAFSGAHTRGQRARPWRLHMCCKTNSKSGSISEIGQEKEALFEVSAVGRGML